MKLIKEPYNIITASVGGQGNILSSDLIGTACVMAGLKITIGETHGLSQRGGPVISNIRISEQFQYGPVMPKGEVDMIQGFEPLEAFKAFLEYGKPGTIVLMNLRPNYPSTVLSGVSEYPEVSKIIEEIEAQGGKVIPLQATDIAKAAGNAVTMNIVMVGALAGTQVLPISKETFLKALDNIVNTSRLNINVKAFNMGMEYVEEYIKRN